MTKKKYKIIYADPPWRFSQGINPRKTFKGNKEELNFHYETLSDKDIINLNIKAISDKECVLFLWTTDAHLEVALKAINSWGFTYKTVAFVWNKKRGFMGKWTVKQCELCLLATKGTAHKLLKSFKEKSYLEENKTIHSKKPDEIRNRIERMFGHIPRIELFARQAKEKDLFGNNSFDGWDTWGNEIKNDIVLLT